MFCLLTYFLQLYSLGLVLNQNRTVGTTAAGFLQASKQANTFLQPFLSPSQQWLSTQRNFVRKNQLLAQSFLDQSIDS